MRGIPPNAKECVWGPRGTELYRDFVLQSEDF